MQQALLRKMKEFKLSQKEVNEMLKSAPDFASIMNNPRFCKACLSNQFCAVHANREINMKGVTFEASNSNPTSSRASDGAC